MEKTYQPNDIEQRWNAYWESQEFYKPSNKGTPYAIMLPPPNVTGTLHMGHGFQLSLMDTLIRRQRMQGYNTLWQPGTDHAGIATQMVVERELAKNNQTRHDLGREAFLEKAWEWREQSGGSITQQMHRLGASLDWERAQFSMGPQVSHATSEAFIKLFEEGLIYRGKRLVNWDPVLQTAVSDLEVLNEEQQGSLWHIRYPLANKPDTFVTIATTRPETMLGDMAIAVHPEDDRYRQLIGEMVQLPLTDRQIPIIADDEVDREFGTGCVKITPAHDFNDYAMGQRHELELLNIMDESACLNDNVPSAYQGMDRFDARQQIIQDLTKQNLMVKTDPHTLQVPMGDRSGVIIEPLLTDQWFIKMESLAKPAIDAVKNGDLRFVPENWNKTYLQWLENIQDWCISRQLWWGHRIPVWYDDQGTPYVGHDEADVRKRHQLTDSVQLSQDEDILDTWFTAALWPFSSLGWPENTDALKTFYPSQVLVTGFDIIFFWVARMVMMGLKLVGDVPFREVYIHGLIRDGQGQKMSKSKGNIIDPIDLIDGIQLEDLIQKRTQSIIQPHLKEQVVKNTPKEFPEGIKEHGTDALRFTFCALASTGRDIRFDLGRIDGYRNFCNKLWNAARFVLMNIEDQPIRNTQTPSITDRWITSRLNHTIEKVNQTLDQYRFDLAAQALYEFIWNDYCDWYLEIAKCQLNDATTSDDASAMTRYTLLSTLETALRLMHPIMPFITEEIWQSIKQPLNIQEPSIMMASYPESSQEQEDPQAEQSVEWLKTLIGQIRNIRSEMHVPPGQRIKALLHHGNTDDQSHSDNFKTLIQSLARLESLDWLESEATPPPSATAIMDQLEIHLPLAGIIDKDAELQRLNKAIEKLEKERTQSEQRLNNPHYAKKAPEHVVNKERDKLQQAAEAIERLSHQRDRIATL
ncbi:MAG TPA: valine--tRNA ligase [Coxiellaceae bacterium]|nr:valine--tRNA ligase [Coxiellaceae bacterium]